MNNTIARTNLVFNPARRMKPRPAFARSMNAAFDLGHYITELSWRIVEKPKIVLEQLGKRISQQLLIFHVLHNNESNSQKPVIRVMWSFHETVTVERAKG